MINDNELKQLKFVGSSKHDLKKFPEDVRLNIGYALYQAQLGEKALSAKPLKGFGGAGVLEVVENSDRDAYRAVYTVRFSTAVYVLHCFQKKSKKGSQTPPRDMDLIGQRLRWAQEDSKT